MSKQQQPDIRFFSFAGKNAPKTVIQFDGDIYKRSVTMDSGVFHGSIFCEAGWFMKPFQKPTLKKHDSAALLVFIGSNPEDPENLNAEIELWIENDKLILTTTCFVFIPKGTAYGNMVIKNLTKPVLHYVSLMDTDTYHVSPAEATAAPGTYTGNVIEKYAPVDGRIPEAPEGFLTLILWIDGLKLKGAPYMEACWFHTTNDTGPEAHLHDNLDELIGFLGTDPDNPEELYAEVKFFVEDREITITKSCIVYIPRGVRHSPILVPKLERPIMHFSGGNGGNYYR